MTRRRGSNTAISTVMSSKSQNCALQVLQRLSVSCQSDLIQPRIQTTLLESATIDLRVTYRGRSALRVWSVDCSQLAASLSLLVDVVVP